MECIHGKLIVNMDSMALMLTLKLATITSLVLLAIAIPIAAWMVLSQSRLRSIVESLANLPLLLPPTVLGFYLLVLMGPRTAFGRTWISVFGHPLAFSFSGLVLGSVIYSFPFALQPLISGFQAVDPEILNAARLLGAGSGRILGRILLPLAGPSVLAAIVLSFAHTIGEFGVVLMIGGDIPGATRTLSIAIFDQVQETKYTAANQTAALLLGISFLALLLVYGRRQWFRNA
jgi:molybdate transport system permease protein